MEFLKIFDELNMKQPKELGNEEEFFGYLINDYIHEQGINDMKMFIKLGFSPVSYVIWKAIEKDLLDKEFAKEATKALDNRIKSLEENDGVC